MILLARALVTVVLAVAALGFGAVGLCGGMWTVVFVPLGAFKGDAGMLAFWLLSVPCAYGGFWAARHCLNKIGTLARPRPTKEETDDPRDR